MKYILGSNSLTVYAKGKPYTVSRSAQIFNAVMAAIRDDDEVKLLEVLDAKNTIINKLSGAVGVRIENRRIMYGDREVTGVVASRVLEMLGAGLDVTPMLKFIENLMQNPSSRAVNELFGFMEACDLPITEDGHFLAYKKVRDDYKDCYSGTLDNSVGNILSMPRNAVDEDKNNTCSYGLHFCSYSYLKHFGGQRVVVVKINPADVVAIPADYNNSKGRTCRYEVVDEMEVDDGMPTTTLDSGFSKGYTTTDTEVDEVETVKNVSVTAKLNPTKVRQIRQRLNNGDTVASVARDFGISERQVRRIRDFEAWTDVI